MEGSDDSSMDIVPSSHSIPKNLGVEAPRVQLLKASFFAASDDEDGADDSYCGYVRQSGKLLGVLILKSATNRKLQLQRRFASQSGSAAYKP